MKTLTLLDMRGEFGCDRILARFLEEDLKFDSFGNLGLIYTLVYMISDFKSQSTLQLVVLLYIIGKAIIINFVPYEDP